MFFERSNLIIYLKDKVLREACKIDIDQFVEKQKIDQTVAIDAKLG